MVGLDAEAARLDGQQGIGAEGLLQEERLVVDEPVHQRCRPVGPEVMADRLDRLEGVEDVEFVPEDRVLQPAQPEEGLRAEALAGYDFPAQSPGMDFGSRQQFQRAGRHGSVSSHFPQSEPCVQPPASVGCATAILSCPLVISSARFTGRTLAPRFLTVLLRFRMGCTRQGAVSGGQYLANSGKT